MKNYWIGVFIGVICGALIMGGVLYRASPGMMLKEKECAYSFDESVTRLEASAAEHNWTIPKIHDLQSSLEKFGYEVRKVKVFALCKPEHAVKVLEGDGDRIVSTMMPCRIALYEKADGEVYASYMNSKMLAGAIGGSVKEVMAGASSDLEEILGSILQK